MFFRRNLPSVFRFYSALNLLVILFVVCGPAFAQSHHAKPNIVFILTDDQRLDDIEYMKSLQELVIKNGVTFKNYFDTVSLCCPSRTSILRGQYAHNTGVETNGGNNGGFAVMHERGLEDSTVATWMHDHGYTTALFGKYLNHYPGQLGPNYIPPGWDNWAVSVKGNPYSEYNYQLNENGKVVNYGSTPADYGTDVYAHKAIQFIKDASKEKKPFFLYLAVYAPHGPATPAPRHEGMFTNAGVPRSAAFNQSDVSKMPAFIQRLQPLSPAEIEGEDRYHGKRAASLQAVDEAIAAIHKTLVDKDALANTYIVFASDNGFHLGEHRMRRGKQTAYDTDIHLPLFIAGPGIKSGRVVDEIVGNIDLAPTFAAMGGFTAPAFVDGRSLLPFLTGGGKPKDWRQCYLVEHWGGGGKGGARRRQMKATARVQAQTAGQKATPEKASESVEEETIEGTQPEAMPANVSAAPEAQAAAVGMSGRKGARRANREMGGIPELHAIRTKDALYTQYVTGEREYYKLSADPAEVDNCATTDNAPQINSRFDRIKALQTSAGETARKLESQP